MRKEQETPTTGRPPIADGRITFGLRVRLTPEAHEALRLQSFQTRRPMGHIVGEFIEKALEKENQ